MHTSFCYTRAMLASAKEGFSDETSFRSYGRYSLILSVFVYIILSIAGGFSANAAQIDLYPPNSFESAVEGLRAGDTLTVHAGTYTDSGRISISVRGTVANPVIIKGADGEVPPVITRLNSASRQNTINIEGASYLTIKGLEITSNGEDGVRLFSGDISHITLEDLHIHDVDVGLNLRSSMHHITIRNNHIHHTGSDPNRTGEGMYIGCNGAACIVSHSLIEGNTVHDTTESNQGDGIEIKRGSHSNIIRGNTIYNTRYPCILLYGTENQPRNLVEGNRIWNCGDSGIQAAADTIIRNNIVLDSNIAFNSHAHDGVSPGNLEIIHNTFVVADICLNISGWSNRPNIVFANNALYCPSNNDNVSALNGVTLSGNVIVPATNTLPTSAYTLGRSVALDFVNADHSHPATKDLHPTADSALLGAGNPAYTTLLDFAGTTRAGAPDAGAYTLNGVVVPPGNGNGKNGLLPPVYLLLL